MLKRAQVKGGFVEGRAHPNPPASQIRAVWWGLEASSQASERTPRLTIYKSFPEERAFSPLDPKWGLISPHVLGAEQRRQAQHRCTPAGLPPPLCRCAQDPHCLIASSLYTPREFESPRGVGEGALQESAPRPTGCWVLSDPHPVLPLRVRRRR